LPSKWSGSTGRGLPFATKKMIAHHANGSGEAGRAWHNARVTARHARESYSQKATRRRPNLDVLARECGRWGLDLSDPCLAPCMTVFSPVIWRSFSSRCGAFEEPPRMSSERDICLRRADEAKRRATQATEPSIKSAYEKVAEHWMLLAQLESLVAAEKK